jgi:hypothetical protein
MSVTLLTQILSHIQEAIAASVGLLEISHERDFLNVVP